MLIVFFFPQQLQSYQQKYVSQKKLLIYFHRYYARQIYSFYG